MPLPPAPTQRAALLSAEAFNKKSNAKTKRPAKSELAVVQAVTASPVDEPTTPVTVLRAPVGSGSAVSSTPTSAKAAPAKAKAPARSKVRKVPVAERKLFVLDTNVLMHDPMCLFRFEEHDIFLPMIVLEELDGHKKGMTEVARNARQTSRTLDALAAVPGADMSMGLELGSTGHGEAGGKLFFQTQPLDYTLPTSLPQGKADNQILGVVAALSKEFAPREVVLVLSLIHI
jgi:PhoH-like ATPase